MGLRIRSSVRLLLDGQILYTLGASTSPFSYPANPALAVGIDPATGTPPNRTVEIYGALPDTPTAYVYTYSLEAQYALPYNLTATLGYQGSSSHKLIRLVNQLFVQPVIPANYFAFAVFIPTPDVNANYNAMNARLTRRFSRGFQFDVLYRWAKSIDTLSNEGPGAETNQTFPQDLRQERGPSDFDVRHNLNISGLVGLAAVSQPQGFCRQVARRLADRRHPDSTHRFSVDTAHRTMCAFGELKQFRLSFASDEIFWRRAGRHRQRSVHQAGRKFPGRRVGLLRSEQSGRRCCLQASDAIRSVVQNTLR